MTVVYDKNGIAVYDSRIKKYVLTATIPFLLVVVVSVVLCFLITEENSLTIRILIESAYVLIGWFSVTVFFVKIKPDSKKRALLVKIFEHQPSVFAAEVISVEKKLTTNDGVKVKEIAVKQGDEKRTVYLDDAVEPEFKQGDSVEFVVAYNYICAYGVRYEKEQ